jgi:hypothetical protein
LQENRRLFFSKKKEGEKVHEKREKKYQEKREKEIQGNYVG